MILSRYSCISPPPMAVGYFRLLRELQESERNVVDRVLRA
jgi:hypothetical protein